MTKKIRILVCSPDSVEVREIEDEYTQWKELVGGYIEVVRRLPGDVVIYCNEDGKFTEKFNRVIPGWAATVPEDVRVLYTIPDAAPPGTIGFHHMYGTFAILRMNRSGSAMSLTDEDVEKWQALLAEGKELAAHLERTS